LQGWAFSKEQVEDNFLKALHTKRLILGIILQENLKSFTPEMIHHMIHYAH